MFGFARPVSANLLYNALLLALSIQLITTVEQPLAIGNSNNLLSNADFESPLSSSFADIAGSPFLLDRWGAENAMSVVAQNGVTPNTGNSMLRVNSTAGISSQTVQLINVSNMAAQIDSGDFCASLSVFVNAHQNFVSGPTGSLSIVFINSNLSGNLLLNTGNHTGPILSQAVTTDIDPSTWERVEIQNAPIPVGTRHILVQISYANSSLANLPAYVDSSLLCIEEKGPPNIFLSFSGFHDGCARINRNLKNPVVGSAVTIYVWVSDDYEIDTGICLDIFTTNSNVIQFASAQTFEANILIPPATPVAVRWGDVFGSTGTVSDNFIDELCAFTVTQGTGILSTQTTGNVFVDELHDDSAGTNAFLFAEIQADVVGSGSTDIRARIGTGGAVHNGNALNPIICKATVNDVVPGDVNSDCLVNLLDVGPFINLLSTGGFSAAADMNCDGAVNLLDIDLFILALSGVCP